MSYRNPDLVEFLLSQCATTEGGCMEFKRKPNDTGYVTIRYLGTKMGAHRALYMAAHGKPGRGLFICHKCDNRRCVNPAHLVAESRRWNMEDMAAKGRSNRGRSVNGGEKNPSARITADQADEIRRRVAAGETRSALAAEFGVSGRHAGRIASGFNWRQKGMSSS